MENAATHECSACGGTGGEAWAVPPDGWYRKPCPVCLGSGRISDVRTARDAMVDAETLRGSMDPLHVGIIADRVGRALIQGWPSSVKKYATQAARAAFRAIPALREE